MAKRGTKVAVKLEVPKWAETRLNAVAPGSNATRVWRRKVIGGYPVPCQSAHCTLDTALRYVTHTSLTRPAGILPLSAGDNRYR